MPTISIDGLLRLGAEGAVAVAKAAVTHPLQTAAIAALAGGFLYGVIDG